MFFDALTMACMAEELRSTVLGGRVQQVLLPDKLSIGLELYARQERCYLLASAHAEMGRLTLSSEKLRRGVEKETGLLLHLRKMARGAILSNIVQPPYERILRLGLEHPQAGRSELVVEVMGRHSNIMLLDAQERVLDSVKRVGPHLSRMRPILPGRPYTPPPPQEKLQPSALTEYRFQQIMAGQEPRTQVWRVLVKALRGMSPLLAREIVFRVLGDPRATVSQVQQFSPFLKVVRHLLDPLEDGPWQPTVVLEDDRPVAYAPYRVTHRGEPQPMPSLSQAIEAYTAAVASVDPYAAARGSVQSDIVAARTRLQRQREALEHSLYQAAQADQWRQWGEWILAYAHTIIPGQAELLADTGEGDPLHIRLDPGLSAVENAQAYFARYRKAERAVAGGPARLKKVDLALRDLEQLETDLQLAANRPEIDAIRRNLTQAGYVKAKGGKGAQSAASGPLSLTSGDGYTILVGRNSRQNDEVTFRRASSSHWWFHARGVPGSHVIVRAEPLELPIETIRQAAQLAAYFSRVRGESSVAVDYTQRHHVRRIPGAAPGLVTYTGERTIRVTPRSPEDLDLPERK